MRKYRVGDCTGYTRIGGVPDFAIVERIEDTKSKRLWGRWFLWYKESYLQEKTVEFYIPKEYC
jgi:hypothetical protein